MRALVPPIFAVTGSFMFQVLVVPRTVYGAGDRVGQQDAPIAWGSPAVPAELCAKARAAIRAREMRAIEPRDDGGAALLRESLVDTDVLHYALDLEVSFGPDTLSGTNTMTVRSLVDGLQVFTFRLGSQFNVSSAILNGTTPVNVIPISATTRQAQLDRAYAAGEEFALQVTYSGSPGSDGLGSINFVNVGGQHVVFSLSEPYYAYTWWPVKDGDVGDGGDNADKATVDVAITAPSNLRSVANGLLQGFDELSGGRRRYRWSSAYPTAPYLVFFATAPFNTWTINYAGANGVMPIEFNVFPGSDTPGNRALWERCATAMPVFEQLYGPYPFAAEKYGIYQFTFGGGMEHQTSSGQGTFSEWVTVHELSHQWWGDAVTCRTWHDIWLNEGFATYSEALREEFRSGASDPEALQAAMNDRRPFSGTGTVYVTDVSDVYRIFDYDLSYLKGAWVVHQLRGVVGDEVFFPALAAYRAQYEGSAATTDDFAAVVSAVAGTDLDWFFQEWVYEPGIPTYRYGWRNARVRERDYLLLHISQTHSASWGVYTMPVRVRVQHSSQPTENLAVWNDKRLQHFVLPLTAAATQVAMDPDDWILASSKTQVSYVNGPPAVVETVPQPGGRRTAAELDEVLVAFSENVVGAEVSCAVFDAQGVEVPAIKSYSAQQLTATLSFSTQLPPGRYTIRADDAITSSAAGQALDGETPDPADPASLPSGDGAPGGDAVVEFEVVHCIPDLTGDGRVDLADLSQLLESFGLSEGVYPRDGDLDENGVVDLADLTILLSTFGADCAE